MYDSVTLLGIVFNVGSVVGVVMMNKYLASVDGFNFMILLSTIHFVVTTVGTRVLLHTGFFEYKEANMWKVLPVAVGSLGSVAFMNLNLAYNSVGFYQLSKLACIPVCLVLERVWYNKTIASNVRATLVPILLGVGLATVFDVSVNFVGTAFAACAVLCTTCAQIFTSRFQKQLKCDALQLLYHTSPLITIGMALLVPVFDNMELLKVYTWPSAVVGRIALSSVLALGVNITNYLVLGKTDALTYQVLGHFKTITILVLGFVLFKAPADWKNLMGITIAMAGVVAYTEIKRKAGAPLPPAEKSTAMASLGHNHSAEGNSRSGSGRDLSSMAEAEEAPLMGNTAAEKSV